MISGERIQSIISKLIDAKIKLALIDEERGDSWWKIDAKKEEIAKLEDELSLNLKKLEWKIEDIGDQTK